MALQSDDVKELVNKMMDGSVVELKSIENETIETETDGGWLQVTPTGKRTVTIVIGG